MSDPIFYNEKPVATLHYTRVPKSRENLREVQRYNIEFDSLECFVDTMLGARDHDFRVGDEVMNFQQFREKILEKTHRIYPNTDGYFMDMINSPAPKDR